MRLRFIVWITKVLGIISRSLEFGAGATWPGEIALLLNPSILQSLVGQLKEGVIIVAGTNGKTTTSLMIKTILEHEGKTVVHNGSGANLLNGIVSAFIQNSSWNGSMNADWGVLEVDENTLPLVIRNVPRSSSSEESSTSREVDRNSSRISLPRAGSAELTVEAFPRGSNNKKLVIILLNLFRDQLDRYGEVDVIVEKWENALSALDTGNQPIKQYQLIVNADDPGVAYLGKKAKGNVIYFGIDDKKYYLKGFEHAADSTFCLVCGARLSYEGIYYSHIGIWKCTQCPTKRPNPDVSVWKSSLLGLYNEYNTLAAVSVAKVLNIGAQAINEALNNFAPAFGRQEEFTHDGKKVKIFLSKNPAGFNASLSTVLEFEPKVMLFVLNDRIPDGRDVSWIWDVDFELLSNKNTNKHHELMRIFISGERAYDLAVRIKYVQTHNSQLTTPRLCSERAYNPVVEPDIKKAVRQAIVETPPGDTLYILPTYSAMLEVRKILTGKKIL